MRSIQGYDPLAVPEGWVRPGSVPLERPEPIARITELTALHWEVPGLDLAERFFEDFGMVPAQRTDTRLYMRGAGAAPYMYRAERGPKPRYVGASFRASSRQELERLADAVPGASITASDDPGGGERLLLTDPDGNKVEITCGQEPSEPVETRREPLGHNYPGRAERVNRPLRPPLQPAAVLRIGHVVLETIDFAASVDWYMRHLGLIPTDVLTIEDGRPAAVFLRTDRGDTPTDHHSLVLLGGLDSRYMHSAYEVVDLDAIAQGHSYLRLKGWKHSWGLGRHALGSQIFDYWFDPHGFEFEHFADSDVFTADRPTEYYPLNLSGLYLWGQDVPAHVKPSMNPSLFVKTVRRLWNGALDLDYVRKLGKAMSGSPRPWLK